MVLKPELVGFAGIHLSNTMVYFIQVFIVLGYFPQHNTMVYFIQVFIYLGYFPHHNSHELLFTSEMNTSSRGSVRIHRIWIAGSRSLIQYLAR